MRWGTPVLLAGGVLVIAAAVAWVVSPEGQRFQVSITEDGAAVTSDERFLNRFESLVAIVGVPAAVFGIALVYQQLRATHRAQRVEWGPYVRVDVVPTRLDLLSDIHIEPAYFESDTQSIEIDSATEPQAEVSAWFRNQQPNPLGVAYGVRARFVMEILSDTEAAYDDSRVVTDIEIPYIQYGKPVRLGLFRFPAHWHVEVHAAALTYQNLYSSGISSKWVSGSEAWHGRLTCLYRESRFSASPVYEPPREGRLSRAWRRTRTMLMGEH